MCCPHDGDQPIERKLSRLRVNVVQAGIQQPVYRILEREVAACEAEHEK
jgi:hypothetical protein